jgi:DNA-binding LytR/AlgR family response regulator
LKIVIQDVPAGDEEEIIIKCHEMSNELIQLLSAIKATEQIVGYEDNRIHRITPSDVYYFEAVDSKVFIYCRQKVFESKQKLYELESQFLNSDIMRISKSVILNIKKILSLNPTFSGRFEAMLDNGEKVIISRQYVPALKKKLNI